MNQSSPPLRTAVLAFLVGALCYVTAVLGDAVVLPGQVFTALWPGCAILLSVLLVVPRNTWPALISAGLVGFVFHDMRLGFAPWTIAVFAAADTIEILIAALGLKYSFDGIPRFNSLTALGKYCFFAVFLAPFVGSFVGATAMPGPYLANWRTWFFSGVLAYLTLTPAILSWATAHPVWTLRSRRTQLEAAILISALVLLGSVIFLVPWRSALPAFLSSLVPLLIWAAVRFGFMGISTSMIVIAFLSIWGAIHGRGPFAGPDPQRGVLWLELFLTFTAAPFMALAALVEERKQAEKALRKSEEIFSKAFRESPVAITITAVEDQRYIDVNETFEHQTGWNREEIVGRTPFDIGLWVEPDKRGQLVKKLLAEGILRDFEVLFRTRDGRVRTGLGSAELIELNGEQCAISVISDVTETKQAQEARLLLERRFSQFFETIPEYCYMVSPTGDILEANPAACRALGYTQEELRGKPVLAIYAPESRSKMTGLFEEWRETGTIHNEEMVLLTKDGKRRTVLLNAGVVKDQKGGVLHSASVQVDITERLEIQQKLRDSQNRLEGIVESAMDAIIAVDEDRRILVFNKAAEKMFGCPVNQVIGTSIDRLIPERFRKSHADYIRHFAETGVTSRAMGTLDSLWGLRAKGEEFPIEASISQTGNGPKKILTVIIRDVTQRKKAEGAMRESEQRFRLVANTAPVMIWMSGTDKRCNYFNQTWLNFTGRSMEAEMGNGWTERVHPDDLQRCLDTYSTAFDRCEEFQMEYRLCRHDGEYRWIVNLGVPRFNPDGAFAGYIGSCLDVTVRRQAEEALAGVSRKLIEAHEEERTWIARELHDDINQRIALLAVNLGVLRSELPSSAKHSIEEMREQLVNLGTDLQALSHRLHSSKLEYLGLETAVAGFCREFSDQRNFTVDFRSHNIPQNLSPEISLCFFRVLQEALQNAAKHSGSNDFRVSLCGAENEIQLIVSDSGNGFDLETVLGGRGLGITSMRERLKLVGGRFSLESHPGKGTTVHACAPLTHGRKSARA